MQFKTGCAKEITILAWEGTFAQLAQMEQVRDFIERRGWVLRETQPRRSKTDLECAAVLWYLSDWNPPAEFAEWHVPLIEDFVNERRRAPRGRARLVVCATGGPNGKAAVAPYAGDLLGRPFGFAFTGDAFKSDGDKPITLEPGQ